jgi:1,4-alpha-glucan branching enzyme
MKKCDGGGEPSKRLGMLKNMVAPRGFPNIGGVHSILGSHDQIGDRHDGKDEHGSHRYYVDRLGGRKNWHARAQCRALFAFQNCCRGLPMTFMGSETLQEGWWHVDQHHRFNWGLAEGEDTWAVEMRRLVACSNKLRVSSPALVQDCRCVVTSTSVGHLHERIQSVRQYIELFASSKQTMLPELCISCIVVQQRAKWT